MNLALRRLIGRRPLRFYLGLLVVVSMLPVVLTAGISFWQVGRGYQRASVDHLLHTSSAISSAVQSELSTAFTTLDVLASMPLEYNWNSPQAGARRLQAGTFLRGRLSVESPGAPQLAAEDMLPSGVPAGLVRGVAEKREPAVSNLFIDAKDGGLRVAISVLYRADNNPDTSLVLTLSPAQLVRTLQRRDVFSPEMLVAVIDGNGRVLARSREFDRFAGKVVPSWSQLKSSSTESRGWFESDSLEGQPVMLAFSRMPGTPGWVTIVAESRETFNARWQESLHDLMLWSVVSLLAALLGASALAHMMLRPVRALASNAQRVASGSHEAMDPVPSASIQEFEVLRLSLAEADSVMRSRSEAERRISVELGVSESRYKLLSEALSLEKDRLEMATIAGGVGIVEFDFSQQRFLWNKQSHLIFDRSEAEFDGSFDAMTSLVHPDDRELVLQRWRQVINEGAVLDLNIRILRPAGEVRHVRMHAQAHLNAQGRPDRIVGIVWDVTMERKSAEALQAAKEAAETAERHKSEYLAFISHEIRTPMNTVLGMARLVMQTQMSARQRDYLSKLDTSAKLLLAIVNDLLDLSKIEAGKMSLEHIEYSLDTLLETVSSATGSRAEGKDLEVVYALHPDVPRRLIGDPLRVGQVLINLVSNAIKFTEKGEVEVSVKVEAMHEDRVQSLRFSVRDTGIGLDEQQAAHLFDPFSQATLHTSREFGGTGLGLSICRKLLELMQGRIWLNSKPGRGSTFSFIIPIAYVDEERASYVRKLNGDVSQHPRRALVVDDNQSARDVLSMMLRGFGLAVDTVSSGRACLDLMARQLAVAPPYDLVLMDWRMPEMDGLQTVRLIYDQYGSAAAPSVLMVTAYAGEDIVSQATDMGLAGLLIKPVTPSVLFDTVCEVLGADVARPEAPGNEPTLEAKLRGRKVLLVDDDTLAREIVEEFLQQVGMEVTQASSGAAVLERMANGTLGDVELVLMDSRMPGMDGAEVTRRMRADPRFATMPVLGLTGESSPSAQEALLAAGMNELLLKPIAPEVLYPALVKWLPLKPAYAALVGKRVLVVDDNQLNREVASEFLLAARMEVETALDGVEAIARLEVSDFDVVLMDIQMPNMDGLTATREIRRNRRWDRLPVIALTAQDQIIAGRATRTAGVDAHLTKPIDEALLYRTLLQFLGHPDGRATAHDGDGNSQPMPLAGLTGAQPLPSAGQAGATSAAIAKPAAAPADDDTLPDQLPGMDLRLALARMGHRPERVRRLLRGFIRDFSGVPAQLDLDMSAAQYAAVGDAAHTVKSAARYLGAESLGNAAEALERVAASGDAATIDTIAKQFSGEFETVLGGIVQYFDDLQRQQSAVETGAKRTELPSHEARRLTRQLAEAAPLVAQGNYAATAMLVQVKTSLTGTDMEPMAESLLEHFEDVELQAATQVLSELTARLGELG